MTYRKRPLHIKIGTYWGNLPLPLHIKYLTILVLILGMTACSDFVDIDPPKNSLISETVFDDPETVESALANIYFKLRDQSMTSGRSGLSTLMGVYSDELDYYGSDGSTSEFYNHNVTAANGFILSWWSNTYNLIYACNDIIKGVDNSQVLSQDDKDLFKGQALFVRAYLNSLLTVLYGDTPYVTTTNYIENNSVSRTPVAMVYDQIIADLIEAIDLLDYLDPTEELVIPNQTAAKALLARIYLYTENWELAAETARNLIDSHSLEYDVSQVFLKNSAETIWQFKPNGTTDMNTYEANQFVIRFIPGQIYALSNSIMAAFEPNDLRLLNWTGSTTSSDGSTTLHYAYKYKALFNESASLEYSIVLRLSEQYLIRAEARGRLGNILGAQDDLNVIRNRAGLENTLASSQNELLDAILQERQVELFTEHGQRWFDLKRMGKADEILSQVKPNWSSDHVLLPIPEAEIEINPNLEPQNSGY